MDFFSPDKIENTNDRVFCEQTLPSAGLICTCSSFFKRPRKSHLPCVNTGHTTKTQTKFFHYLSYDTHDTHVSSWQYLLGSQLNACHLFALKLVGSHHQRYLLRVVKS